MTLDELFTMNEPTSDQLYCVVINHEEQYSIWPLGKEIPLGWHEAGKQGSKDECLSHIETVWTDMRPLSLRLAMEGKAVPE
jgi:MbtH protein